MMHRDRGPAVRPLARLTNASLQVPRAWGLAEALAQFPGLSIRPRADDTVHITGELGSGFLEAGKANEDARYLVRVAIPRGFPRVLPTVWETGGRIPRTFHHHPDGTLCLGSPIAQSLAIHKHPTVGTFVERVVVPYLYSHAFYVRRGHLPDGELAHGALGLERDARRLFRLPQTTSVHEFLRLAGLRRRVANKQPCPCGSSLRLGRCHATAVRQARNLLGRARCREERSQLLRLLAAEHQSRRSREERTRRS